MAQERRHKSRSRRRRGRFGFFYKLLSVLLVAAALTTACVVFFRVNNITVIGNSRYTVQHPAGRQPYHPIPQPGGRPNSAAAALCQLGIYPSGATRYGGAGNRRACRRSGHLGWKGMVVYRGPGQGTGAGRFPGFGDVCHGTDRPGPCSGTRGRCWLTVPL